MKLSPLTLTLALFLLALPVQAQESVQDQINRALCQQDWNQAIQLVSQLIGSPNLSDADRSYYVAYRKQLQSYQDGTVSYQMQGCDQLIDTVDTSQDIEPVENEAPSNFNWDAEINRINTNPTPVTSTPPVPNNIADPVAPPAPEPAPLELNPADVQNAKNLGIQHGLAVCQTMQLKRTRDRVEADLLAWGGPLVELRGLSGPLIVYVLNGAAKTIWQNCRNSYLSLPIGGGRADADAIIYLLNLTCVVPNNPSSYGGRCGAAAASERSGGIGLDYEQFQGFSADYSSFWTNRNLNPSPMRNQPCWKTYYP